MKKSLLFLCLLAMAQLRAQVPTNYNSPTPINEKGHFQKNFTPRVHTMQTLDSTTMQAHERSFLASSDVKPFRFAEPVAVSIDVPAEGAWVTDGSYSYCKLDIQGGRAKSLSINFDKFHLPEGAEMYIYNDKGTMITGPITAKENNPSQLWGSAVYRGNHLTLELKVPSESRQDLSAHISNIAYGYKEIFSSFNFGGFGHSASCEINVLCPLGNAWTSERNSVALILNDNGTVWCSGSLINNACSVNIPYLLTANHCLDNGAENVAQWRFILQYWSQQCSPSQDNTNTVMFNGSVLEANSAPSDFALVRLNQTPQNLQGIVYGGWNNAAGAATSTVGIHHPQGDVMKISSDANAPVAVSWMGGPVNHWRAHFQQGTVEPGSSGSPLYDQNHRVVGQLHGDQNNMGNYCAQQIGEYGMFSVSWPGGGTAATSLRPWLDPLNSGAVVTNTTAVSGMLVSTITGPTTLCSASNYTVNVPAGATVTWSANPNIVSIGTTGNTATITPTGHGFTTLTATIATPCGNGIQLSELVSVGTPPTPGTIMWSPDICQEELAGIDPVSGANPSGYTWSFFKQPYNGSNLETFPNSGTHVKLSLDQGSGTYNVGVTASNSCGTSAISFISPTVTCSGGGGHLVHLFSVSPNPTSSMITITPMKATAAQLQNPMLATGGTVTGVDKVTVYDASGKPRKTSEYRGSTGPVQLQVGDLKAGNYFIEIISGQNIDRQELIILH